MSFRSEAGMKICFAVEYFWPSLGGAQEVVRHLATGLVRLGHEVSVATSHHPERTLFVLDGVAIHPFPVAGSALSGMSGPLADYQNFICQGAFDLICVYAAQQWAWDALLPVLPEVKAKLVWIPCGFSAYGQASSAWYFKQLAEHLHHVDLLVFHTASGRDAQWAAAYPDVSSICIPNGAEAAEFDVPLDPEFAVRHSLEPSRKLVLTVGTVTGGKGHLELIQSLAFLPAELGPVHLMLNGARPPTESFRQRFFRELGQCYRQAGLGMALRHSIRRLAERAGLLVEVDDFKVAMARAEQQGHRITWCDLPRAELRQAYLHADLFVLASHFEYSPLVLFEAAAAGLAFISSPAGNADEICEWTGAGVLCAAEPQAATGRLKIDPAALAETMTSMLNNEALRQRLGRQGAIAVRESFDWPKLVLRYETAFQKLFK